MTRRAGSWWFLGGSALLAALLAACASKAVAPEDATPPPNSIAVSIPVDGILLDGHLFGGTNDVGVILSHMQPNDQTGWYDFAGELASRGYAALTYDFRGYGASPGDEDFATLDDDLRAAVRFMRARGKTQVFLVGASMGGTTSLVVASGEDVAGVVAISAPSDFEGQDALAATPNIRAPKLFVSSDDDAAAIVSQETMLEVAPAPKDVQTYIGNLHGAALFGPESEHAAAVRQRVIAFLDEYREP